MISLRAKTASPGWRIYDTSGAEIRAWPRNFCDRPCFDQYITAEKKKYGNNGKESSFGILRRHVTPLTPFVRRNSLSFPGTAFLRLSRETSAIYGADHLHFFPLSPGGLAVPALAVPNIYPNLKSPEFQQSPMPNLCETDFSFFFFFLTKIFILQSYFLFFGNRRVGESRCGLYGKVDIFFRENK